MAEEPPPRLYHYTSPAGLIGIVKSKEIWATNLGYMNDAKEIGHAVDYARLAIQNLLPTAKWSIEEEELLRAMGAEAGSAAKRVYAFSLSEEHDLLAQWRAYCPPGGGYSMGLPTPQIKVMAEKQNFYFCRCIYDHTVQYRIAREMVLAFVERFRERTAITGDKDAATKECVWEFSQQLARFGPVLKHPSFQEEREWRLVGVVEDHHPQIDFRPGSSGIVPFFHFKLADEDNPNLVRSGPSQLVVFVGPTISQLSSQTAVQYLLSKYLPGAGHGPSSSSYLPR